MAIFNWFSYFKLLLFNSVQGAPLGLRPGRPGQKDAPICQEARVARTVANRPQGAKAPAAARAHSKPLDKRGPALRNQKSEYGGSVASRSLTRLLALMVSRFFSGPRWPNSQTLTHPSLNHPVAYHHL